MAYVPAHLRRDVAALQPLTNFRRSVSTGPAPVVPQAQQPDAVDARLTTVQARHEEWREGERLAEEALTLLFGPPSPGVPL